MVSVNGMGDLGRWLRGMRRYWEWLDFLKAVEDDRVQRVLTGSSRKVDSHDIILLDPSSEKYWAERRGPEYRTGKRELTIESAGAMLDYRPETVVHRIAPRAAMWVCARNDGLLPNDESGGMFAKAGEPKKLEIIEEFDHHALYHGAGLERMMGCSTQWFDIHLKSNLGKQS